ncbi:hypothetical protein M2405_004128 [Rhodococcus erythropolis]|nr:hypothetical protein [Rhodococcus erythropolis]MCS4255825.1 hypothetical protein [Rhodococcus erythropolis]MCW2425342.1 hypothetical protein [Rhodococcus erythropolis]
MFDLIGELTFPDTTAFTDEQLNSVTRSAEAGDVGRHGYGGWGDVCA